MFAAWAPAGVAQEAETDTLSIQEQIQQLMQQVQELRAQLAQMRGEQQELRTEVREAKQLTRTLFRGLSGEDVEELQALLASDESIYPEGLVTGFFGPLTEQAVRRFQARANISQVGTVGPITRARINELLQGVGENAGDIPPGFLRYKLKVEVDGDEIKIEAETKCDSSGPSNICKFLDDDEKDNPARLCSAELAADPDGFAEAYGTNDNSRNAFGMCVSQKADALDDDEDEDEEDDEEDDDDQDEDEEDDDDNSGSGSN